MKKNISLLLSAAMLASPVLAAQEEARSAGAPEGTVLVSDSFTASPDAVLTRAMVARLFYQLEGQPDNAGEPVFSDVSASDGEAIGWAAGAGLVNGVGGGRYEPDRPLTRQAFAAMLYRWMGSPRAADGGLMYCGDRNQAAAWALEGLNWCVYAGILGEKAGEALAPTAFVTAAEALSMVRRAQALPDLTQMEADLAALTAEPRPVGSQGEHAAVQYLKQRFSEMGYAGSLQTCADREGRTGTNVIAVKQANRADADILVLSAYHDSVPSARGANDNASGVAALLFAAEMLKDVSTDTELCFISFTDEENGKNGSRFYTASLSQQERERMVGDIQLDMLGGLGSHGTLACTTDGQTNWVSDALQKQAPGCSLAAETASDHSSFQLAGVPSVLLTQAGRGYLYHSVADRADQLDLYAVAEAARAAAEAAREIASAETGSYRETARAQGCGAYRQTRQTVIYFDSALADTEAAVGAAGELTDHREVKGSGWTDTYDTYRYAMGWFGGETPMNTYYQYRNGYLQSILIRPCETGYTLSQVRSLITAMYGEPTRVGTDRQGNPCESWQDEIYGKYITLTDDPAGCTVAVSKFSVGVSNVLSVYSVTAGQAQITDPEDKQVWDLLCALLPEENRQKIAQFRLFTDGASNILAFTSPVPDENGKPDNTAFSISIDCYDVYDENGCPRDWSKLIYTILHEYGHVLLEDETQVDLSRGTTTHDPAGYVEGSFRKAFYDRLWKELGDTAANDYEQAPTRYVSRYGANYFHEDIADTFAVFLLSGKPAGDTVAEEKLRFFWADPEMLALRASIRKNLGLCGE